MADTLLRHGASPEIPSTRENLTPLQLAAAHDDAELFELFLIRKLDLDFDELSILFQLAVRSGGAGVLGVLINRELYKGLRFTQQSNPLRDLWKINKVSMQTEEGYTLLHEAVVADNADALELLLDENFIPIDAVDNRGNTALHLAALEKREEAVKKLLVTRGVTRRAAFVSAEDKGGNQPLHRAAQVAGNRAIIKQLLDARASLTAQNKSHRTPLDLASERGHSDNVEALLTGEHAKPELHPSVLHFMARNGYRDAIKQFDAQRLRRYINEPDKSRKNPLQASIRNNHYEAAVALIETGANVSSIKPHGSYTHDLLFFVASNNNIKLLQKLIADGWDLGQTNSLGQTVVHIAAHNGFDDVLRLLHDSQADMDKPDGDGNTPLHLAAINGHLDALSVLIEVSKKPWIISNEEGNTPLHSAVIHGHLEVLTFLLGKTDEHFDINLVQPSSNIRTASHLQWSAFVSPLKRLGHFLIEEVYKLMKPCFKVFC